MSKHTSIFDGGFPIGPLSESGINQIGKPQLTPFERFKQKTAQTFKKFDSKSRIFNNPFSFSREEDPNVKKNEITLFKKDPFYKWAKAIESRKKAGIDVTEESNIVKKLLQKLPVYSSKTTLETIKLLESLKSAPGQVTPEAPVVAPKVSLKVTPPKIAKGSRTPQIAAQQKIQAAAGELDLTKQLEALKPTQGTESRSRLSFLLQGIGGSKIDSEGTFGSNLLQIALGSLRGRAAFDQQKVNSEKRFDKRMDEFNKLKTLQLIKSQENITNRSEANQRHQDNREDRALARRGVAGRAAATRDLQRELTGKRLKAALTAKGEPNPDQIYARALKNEEAQRFLQAKKIDILTPAFIKQFGTGPTSRKDAERRAITLATKDLFENRRHLYERARTQLLNKR